ncbi:uncharacterized protein CEXT_496581 [Caerostris extrusa]|uniref:Glycine-rich protein n=1 Tax=Caerostris extrusa TaxID=172846 RepID=A0AAV4S8I7_CAEEX|nr:uncharacterized protein CEXT_496581 [Caerostris extrusa]
MLRKFVIALLIAVILSSCVFQSVEGGHKLKLKKIAKALLLANALTGKKILFPLPLPLPIPIFQEHVKHVPYEMMDYGGGGYGMGGGMGGGYGGGMGGGYGGGMGGGYGGGMGEVMVVVWEEDMEVAWEVEDMEVAWEVVDMEAAWEEDTVVA